MKDLDFLRGQAEDFFEAKGYREACRKRYRHTWDHLKDFMLARGIKAYTPDVGYEFLSEWHDGKEYGALSHRQQERYRHITVLSDIVNHGHIRRCVHHNKTYEFPDELGQPFREFIEGHRDDRASSTLCRYAERINNLYQFLKERELTLRDFTVPVAIQYIKKLDDEKNPCDRDNIIMTTRVFLRYLSSRGLLCENLPEKWCMLFKAKKTHNKKIPSVYTRDEVEKILGSIDRSHPQGKRDYAMALLAARYGLRVSDIIGLRFCNLIWEDNRIVLVQQKTGKKVSLPMSEEVGSAIIDYIKNGRPAVDVPYVFITAIAPYRQLSSNVLCACIADWMRSAGIDSTGKKKGPHALRHSLATNLLGLNNPLPVISEILGHSTTQSTTTYTRVSMDMLRQCALDVPFVPSVFYDNLYG